MPAITQGQSIAEAAHLAKMEERRRCLEICARVLAGLTNGGARNAVKLISNTIRSEGE
jgi:hypothetical protein